MFPDRLGDLGGRAGAVHEDDALGHIFREEQVALADMIVEIDVLALHAVGQFGRARDQCIVLIQSGRHFTLKKTMHGQKIKPKKK